MCRFGGFIALPGFKSNKITIEGIDISYIDRNPTSKKTKSSATAVNSINTSNPTTIVFIHGVTSQKLSWAPVIRSLPKSWRVIAIDLPGHGKSGFSEELNYSVVSMGEFLHEVSKPYYY